MSPIFVGSDSSNSRIRSDRIGFAASTTNPGSAAEGDGYYNSTDDQLKVYDGSAWNAIQGSGTFEATVTGTLANGQTVIINTDGTISGVSTSAVAESKGSIVQYEPGGSGVQYPSGVSIGNGKVVFAYSDFGNSRHGTVVVGTISGSTITFGTPAVFESNQCDWIGVTYDSNSDRICIAHARTSGGYTRYGRATVASVSGTSFTFGSSVQFHGGSTDYIQAKFDSVSNKVIVSFRDSTAQDGKVAIGDITAATNAITFGSDTTFNGSNNCLTVASAFDVKKNRVLVAFRNTADSNRSYAVVGQISGTSISFGTPQKFTNNVMGECQVVYNPDANSAAGSSLIVYQDGSDNDRGRCLGAQIDPSNNSISFGQILPFHDAQTSSIGATYDPNAKRYIVSYKDNADSNKLKVDIGYEQSPGYNNGYFRDYIGTGNAFEITTTSISNSFPVYNAQDKNIALGIDDDGVVYTPPSVGTDLTAENFIGFSDAAYSNAQTGRVQIVSSVDDAQTGLTTGQKYYVQKHCLCLYNL